MYTEHERTDDRNHDHDHDRRESEERAAERAARPRRTRGDPSKLSFMPPTKLRRLASAQRRKRRRQPLDHKLKDPFRTRQILELMVAEIDDANVARQLVLHQLTG